MANKKNSPTRRPIKELNKISYTLSLKADGVERSLHDIAQAANIAYDAVTRLTLSLEKLEGKNINDKINK